MRAAVVFGLACGLSACGVAPEGGVAVRVRLGSGTPAYARENGLMTLLAEKGRLINAVRVCNVPSLQVEGRDERNLLLDSSRVDVEVNLDSLLGAASGAAVEGTAEGTVVVRPGKSRLFSLSGVIYDTPDCAYQAGAHAFPVYGESERLDIKEAREVTGAATFAKTHFKGSDTDLGIDVTSSQFARARIVWAPILVSCPGTSITSISVKDLDASFEMDGGSLVGSSLQTFYMGPLGRNRPYSVTLVCGSGPSTVTGYFRMKDTETVKTGIVFNRLGEQP